MNSKLIAAWLLRHEAETSGRATVTNMKLQKLVYLAEAAYGALYGERLVDEPIQAWQHGPAIKPLYGAYKYSGRSPIAAPPEAPALPEKITEVLETVWDTFGGMTPARLRTLTHDLGPYEAHYRPGVLNIELPPEEIHGAWFEFLSDGAAWSDRERTDALRALMAVPSSDQDQDQDEDEDVSTDQLMSDFKAYAPAG